MPVEEKFQWLMNLKKILIPSQKDDAVDEAIVKLWEIAKQLEVQIAKFSAIKGLQEKPVMCFDSLSNTYSIRYPLEADMRVCIGIVTTAVLLIIFSHQNNHFSYDTINRFDNLGEYLARTVCDETNKIIQILQKWEICY